MASGTDEDDEYSLWFNKIMLACSMSMSSQFNITSIHYVSRVYNYVSIYTYDTIMSINTCIYNILYSGNSSKSPAQSIVVKLSKKYLNGNKTSLNS